MTDVDPLAGARWLIDSPSGTLVLRYPDGVERRRVLERRRMVRLRRRLRVVVSQPSRFVMDDPPTEDGGGDASSGYWTEAKTQLRMPEGRALVTELTDDDDEQGPRRLRERSVETWLGVDRRRPDRPRREGRR